ncbi:hypothetical protein QJS66_17600 [Kocuria rhizophila]|nr:hypothetical protein QJS66_17600 [Kocuria rhizophila]
MRGPTRWSTPSRSAPSRTASRDGRSWPRRSTGTWSSRAPPCPSRARPCGCTPPGSRRSRWRGAWASAVRSKANIDRIREKYARIGRPAPTKIDLRIRAIEDGLVDPEDSITTRLRRAVTSTPGARDPARQDSGDRARSYRVVSAHCGGSGSSPPPRRGSSECAPRPLARDDRGGGLRGDPPDRGVPHLRPAAVAPARLVQHLPGRARCPDGSHPLCRLHHSVRPWVFRAYTAVVAASILTLPLAYAGGMLPEPVDLGVHHPGLRATAVLWSPRPRCCTPWGSRRSTPWSPSWSSPCPQR